MLQRRTQSALIGAVFLGASAIWISALARPAPRAGSPVVSVPEQLLDYALSAATEVDLQLPSVRAEYGDPIFTRDENGQWVQAGYLAQVDDPSRSGRATALWYSDLHGPQDCDFSYSRSTGTLGEVLETMLPLEKRERIVELIAEANQQHGAALMAAFRPIIERTIRDTAPVIEEGVRASVARHRAEIAALGSRYEQSFVRRRLVPLVREEVLPSVRLYGEPLAKEIAGELWERASVWRFGWAVLYDKTSLPARDLTEKEFDRFIAEEAVPVVEARVDALVAVFRDILTDIANNPRVRVELEALGVELAGDPDVQRLLETIVQEAIVDNAALRDVWVRNWQSAESQRALRMVGARLEPVVRSIGDELFGTRQGGINPEFARVLRSQILRKDRRWIVATPRAAGIAPDRVEGGVEDPIEVTLATESGVYPVLVMAGGRDS